MVTQVTQWKADDDSLWNTEHEAMRQNAKLTLAKYIEVLCTYGKVDPDELLEALTIGTLGDAVAQYHALY